MRLGNGEGSEEIGDYRKDDWLQDQEVRDKKGGEGTDRGDSCVLVEAIRTDHVFIGYGVVMRITDGTREGR